MAQWSRKNPSISVLQFWTLVWDVQFFLSIPAESQEITIWNVNLFFVDLNLFRFFDAPKNNAREFAQSIESTLVPTFTLYIYTYIYIYLHIYIYTYILSCLE
jgi:hypothetical protein